MSFCFRIVSGNDDRDEIVREEFQRRFRAEIKDMTKRGTHSRCVKQRYFTPNSAQLYFCFKFSRKGFGRKPKVSLEKAKKHVLELFFVRVHSSYLIDLIANQSTTYVSTAPL